MGITPPVIQDNADLNANHWKPLEKYIHRSLPYKASPKDDNLRFQPEKILEPAINNAKQMGDLGFSQQCEHVNRDVILRAPKSLH